VIKKISYPAKSDKKILNTKKNS